MKLRSAQLAEAPDASFSLTGATLHPLLRDAQLTEQFSILLSLGAQRASNPCAARSWQKP
ncbi:hypothetical protein A2U01_0105298, partial [Trifolium medium]|nr:hypothetical protein [Trifolium medium]